MTQTKPTRKQPVVGVYYHVTLLQPRIAFAVGMTELNDVPGKDKIAETTEALEAFNDTFEVRSQGGSHTLVVYGEKAVLESLFPNGQIEATQKDKFRFVVEATQMSGRDQWYFRGHCFE